MSRRLKPTQDFRLLESELLAMRRISSLRTWRYGVIAIASLCTLSLTLLVASAVELDEHQASSRPRDNAIELFAKPAYRVLDQKPNNSGQEKRLEDRLRRDSDAWKDKGMPGLTSNLLDQNGPRSTPSSDPRMQSTFHPHEVLSGSMEPTVAPTASSSAVPDSPQIPHPEPPEPTHQATSEQTEPSVVQPTTVVSFDTGRRHTPRLRSESEATTTAVPLRPGQPVLRTRHDHFEVQVSRARGIVLPLHDGIIALGLSLVKDLRCLGNNELIQVYHCFPNELSPASRELLLRNETRLEIIDVCTSLIESGNLTTPVAARFRSFWIKPLALLHSNLREVMLLDADAIPMRDPAVVRSLPGYLSTGTTFFYDRVVPLPHHFNADVRGMRGVQLLRRWVETFYYAAFNLTGPAPSNHLINSLAYDRKTCHEMDSSLVPIDKSRAGKALDVLWLLITKSRFEMDFSWGDKEAFWLAYEFAHVKYSFSPWAASVVSSWTNHDVEIHPETLCGSLAHYLPVADSTPELLYVNGRALLDPFPDGIDETRRANKNLLYNLFPTHVTPRHVRKPKPFGPRKYFDECLVGLGSTPLPDSFHARLLRRRTFYMAVRLGVFSALDQCFSF